MEKVDLIFAKGTHPYSYLVRFRYQSRWSHVGVIIDGVVHEAANPDGVIKTPLDEFIARYGESRIARAWTYAEPGWRERAESLQGMDYDFYGAAGIGFFTTKLDDPDKLWCSHHVGIILGTLRPERLNMLSPEHIWIASRNYLV